MLSPQTSKSKQLFKENNNSWSQASEESMMLMKTSDWFWLEVRFMSVELKGGQNENCSLVERTLIEHVLPCRLLT